MTRRRRTWQAFLVLYGVGAFTLGLGMGLILSLAVAANL